MKSKKTLIIDRTRSPYPAGSPETTMATIAGRAVGGKFAMVERGASQALVVSIDKEHPDVVGCDSFDVRCDHEKDLS